ncbi:CCA tRNA nucleotidyltransferase [Candidatus Pristimantibacillus sp. PTI5]|uniref:CCA tRNA nucleotidyltransferase n=1 Tax=Candidatus Pristimantibacillus sp. PTI5 TaxID=3400422 RepID=UPI003B02BF71
MRLAFSDLILSALPIVNRLREHHFEAFFVGGAVRDTVLGLPIKDVDIATSARPEQVLELFEHCIPTGLQHGTITVINNDTGYEVTTFRLESAYEDHRKPESVLYITELEGDLLRRDFTMNAMALAADGVLHDPYGGMADLRSNSLRSVGDPNARFQEDALRMLRAVRFIGVYRLIPTYRTWRALRKHRALLAFIAMERVQAELDKMLSGGSPQRALHFAVASGLLLHLKEPFCDEAERAIRQAEKSDGAAERFARLHELAAVDLRWAALAIGLDLSVDAAQQVTKVLRFSNSRSKLILSMVEIHRDMLKGVTEASGRELRLKWLSLAIRYGKQALMEWLDVLRVLPEAKLSFSDSLLTQLNEWLEQMVISKLKQLSVNGKELTSHMEKQAGPWVSEYLNQLLLLVAAGELENEKSALLGQASLWN